MVPQGRLVGHIVSKEGIVVDPDKLAIILTLPIILEHITGVKGFLGSTNYYPRFIYFYVEIAKSLTHLMKKIDALGVWTEECTKVINKLKK